MLCSYGCGREAVKQFKNGNWCCSSNVSGCPMIRDKKRKKKPKTIKIINVENNLCYFGCGNRAEYQLINGKKCCSESCNSCPEMRKKNTKGLLNLGDKHPSKRPEVKEKRSKSMKGKNRRSHTEEWKRNHTKRMKGNQYTKGKKLGPQKKERIEKRAASIKKSGGNRKWMLNGGSEYLNSFPVRGYKNNKEWMINEGAAYTNSFLKNPSKEQVELFKICCLVLPNPVLNYPSYRGRGKRSYSLDIADSRIGIVIEFDGYWHFDSKESIDYHKKRQEELEEEGWKFLRYNIFQPFPTKEQVLEDIRKLLF